MGGGVCVGGIVEATAMPVRLLPIGEVCHQPDCGFNIGDIWTMHLRPRPNPRPPHIEDHDEWGARKVGAVADLIAFIKRVALPCVAEPIDLFDGTLQFTSRGRGFLRPAGPLPSTSTQFFILPKPLISYEGSTGPRYCMEAKARREGETALDVKYVGFENPPARLPQGTLVRISLARWRVMPDAPDRGEECWLQLSGWFGIPGSPP